MPRSTAKGGQRELKGRKVDNAEDSGQAAHLATTQKRSKRKPADVELAPENDNFNQYAPAPEQTIVDSTSVSSRKRSRSRTSQQDHDTNSSVVKSAEKREFLDFISELQKSREFREPTMDAHVNGSTTTASSMPSKSASFDETIMSLRDNDKNKNNARASSQQLGVKSGDSGGYNSREIRSEIKSLPQVNMTQVSFADAVASLRKGQEAKQVSLSDDYLYQDDSKPEAGTNSFAEKPRIASARREVSFTQVKFKEALVSLQGASKIDQHFKTPSKGDGQFILSPKNASPSSTASSTYSVKDFPQFGSPRDSPSNPFVKRPGEPITPHIVKKRRLMNQLMAEGDRPGKITYVFRGKRIEFDDYESEEDEDEEFPLKPKPRLLFPEAHNPSKDNPAFSIDRIQSESLRAEDDEAVTDLSIDGAIYNDPDSDADQLANEAISKVEAHDEIYEDADSGTDVPEVYRRTERMQTTQMPRQPLANRPLSSITMAEVLDRQPAGVYVGDDDDDSDTEYLPPPALRHDGGGGQSSQSLHHLARPITANRPRSFNLSMVADMQSARNNRSNDTSESHRQSIKAWEAESIPRRKFETLAPEVKPPLIRRDTGENPFLDDEEEYDEYDRPRVKMLPNPFLGPEDMVGPILSDVKGKSINFANRKGRVAQDVVLDQEEAEDEVGIFDKEYHQPDLTFCKDDNELADIEDEDDKYPKITMAYGRKTKLQAIEAQRARRTLRREKTF
ncbi:hypothetical protein BZG36_03679 [Bifiguratus adelaidae]|uniref:Uncharacterized protein n=1 Tax=Bifiguratus adelaidae TaxID=1938954 RepID=A0A261XZT6_9FUNG|nr:hypothetical protein BZG36_03679 [Bifiguratus adelaidae]